MRPSPPAPLRHPLDPARVRTLPGHFAWVDHRLRERLRELSLEEIAVLLELQGENPFRANAYARAGRTIAQLETNIADVVAAGTLDQVPGVGETLRDKITVLVTTGKLPFYEDLKAKTPPGLLQMLRLPGMGPKKVKLLYDTLAIDDLAKLKAECDKGTVAKLKGFGEKTQKNILEGLAFLDQMGERVRLDQAMAIAEAIVAGLKKAPGIQRMELCGSVRRRRETIKDIDILVSSKDAAPIMDAFVNLPMVKKIIGHGETKSSVVVAGVDHHSSRVMMNADLRVVSDEQFPFALTYFTGSKEHNVHMRQRAIDYGYKLNEYDLAGYKKTVKDEADIYKALDLAYVPPELREDTGEIDAAAVGKLPGLLELDDIHGVFHNHTTWSDGAASLEQMADAAKKLGYQYLGIADHSQSLTVANGLSPDRVRQQQKDMDAEREVQGLPPVQGHRVRHPRGRLDGLPGRCSGELRLRRCQCPLVLQPTRRRNDRSNHQSDFAPARHDARPRDRSAASETRRVQGRSRRRPASRGQAWHHDRDQRKSVSPRSRLDSLQTRQGIGRHARH